jgi:hypothetical protein
MTTTLSRADAIQRLRDLGFQYVGRDEARQIWSASRPEPVLEPMPLELAGRHQDVLVGRYALRPGVDFVKAVMPEATFPGEAPEMFSTGVLPVFTASGIDPELLRNVRWTLRHAAAMSSSRALVLQMIETGDANLQTREGQDALTSYFAEVWRWATTPPPTEPTDDEAASLFGNLFPPTP